ncbi:FAD-dependent oxidoreductase [Vibrio sp. PP-XX7]
MNTEGRKETQPHKTDVLIIGGGFMGAASAFFLRQRPSVTLL